MFIRPENAFRVSEKGIKYWSDPKKKEKRPEKYYLSLKELLDLEVLNRVF